SMHSLFCLFSLTVLLCFVFFFHRYRDHRSLHSFPTRRSSDLATLTHDTLFLISCSFTAGDNCTRMTHTLSWRCCCPTNKAGNWFVHIFFHPLCRFFFGCTSNFTNHHYSICFWVFVERF